MTGLINYAASLCVAVVLGLVSQAAEVKAQTAEVPEFVQIQLTDAQVVAFIGAQDDLAAISKKIEAAGDKEDPKLDAELEALAKKHGFTTFDQLEDVAANVMFILDITDPKTGEFSDPKLDIKTEMADLEADKSLTAEEKAKRKAQLDEELKTIPDLKYKENIAVVNKHRQALEKAMQ